jgi:hypothetical protein
VSAVNRIVGCHCSLVSRSMTSVCQICMDEALHEPPHHRRIHHTIMVACHNAAAVHEGID